MQIIFTMVRSIARPLVDCRIMRFRREWDAILVVGCSVFVELLVEKFGSHDTAKAIPCDACKSTQIDRCRKWPALSLPLAAVSSVLQSRVVRIRLLQSCWAKVGKKVLCGQAGFKSPDVCLIRPNIETIREVAYEFAACEW